MWCEKFQLSPFLYFFSAPFTDAANAVKWKHDFGHLSTPHIPSRFTFNFSLHAIIRFERVLQFLSSPPLQVCAECAYWMLSNARTLFGDALSSTRCREKRRKKTSINENYLSQSSVSSFSWWIGFSTIRIHPKSLARRTAVEYGSKRASYQTSYSHPITRDENIRKKNIAKQFILNLLLLLLLFMLSRYFYLFFDTLFNLNYIIVSDSSCELLHLRKR